MAIQVRDLPLYREREFYSNRNNFTDAQKLIAIFDELVAKPVQVDSEAVEFFAAWRELEPILTQEYWGLFVERSADTEDLEKRQAFLTFCEKVLPVWKTKSQALKEKVFNNTLLRLRLEGEAPLTFRQWSTDQEIFRAENIPIATEVARLVSDFDRVNGAQTTEWQGRPVTMAYLVKAQESVDAEERKAAWQAEMRRRLQDKTKFDLLFDELYQLRQKEAQNAGQANYRDYIFLTKHRFDYSPEDCLAFQGGLREFFLPLAEKIHQKRTKNLGLKDLRPWDLHADITGEMPMQAFADAKELEQRVGSVIKNFDREFFGFFQLIQKNNLFDLENRKGKSPGGFQVFFPESRLPFIFMNSAGSQRDVFTLLHECGHAFHSLLSRDIEPFQRTAPMEFCEVASMSMELMALENVRSEFGAACGRQLERFNNGSIPQSLLRIAMVDSFQHWVYTDPSGSKADARHAKWLELYRSYLPGVAIDGVEEEIAASWQRIHHIFQFPFYFVEYGIAQLGALQFWQKYHIDAKEALADYKTSLAAGGTLGPKDLFRRARLEWPMNSAILRRVAAFLDERLEATFSGH